jgi:hypothetical protein
VLLLRWFTHFCFLSLLVAPALVVAAFVCSVRCWGWLLCRSLSFSLYFVLSLICCFSFVFILILPPPPPLLLLFPLVPVLLLLFPLLPVLVLLSSLVSLVGCSVRSDLCGC